jgi:hypothetical protein
MPAGAPHGGDLLVRAPPEGDVPLDTCPESPSDEASAEDGCPSAEEGASTPVARFAPYVYQTR